MLYKLPECERVCSGICTEGTNLDHVVGKEATLLEFEDVYATDR